MHTGSGEVGLFVLHSFRQHTLKIFPRRDNKITVTCTVCVYACLEFVVTKAINLYTNQADNDVHYFFCWLAVNSLAILRFIVMMRSHFKKNFAHTIRISSFPLCGDKMVSYAFKVKLD